MIESRSYRFTRAICREPGNSIADGIRAGDGSDPDPVEFLREHTAYVTTLKASGADVTVLEPLEEYPDSVFVEDPAICPGGAAIQLRPGASSRLGEAEQIAATLEAHSDRFYKLETGFVDGGDILMTDDEVLIGLSERTDETGLKELQPILAGLGYNVRTVQTPQGVLHFKSDCGLLDSNTIFSTGLLAASNCFAGYDVITAPAGEEAAANLIRFNDFVIMRTGFPKTEALLQSHGYQVKTLDANEAPKVDGGLSCMSLRIN